VGLGIVSRAVDTASWAQPWFGLVVLPWLIAAWLAGAWLGRGESGPAWGAFAGLVTLTATVGAYVALAGADGAALLPRLTSVAFIAGPAFGFAGALRHRGDRGRLISIAALAAALVGQALLLATIGPDLP
jgi:hypothetical protein